MNFNLPHPLIAGIVCVFLIILMIFFGYLVGNRVRSRLKQEAAPVAAVVAAILGLLAFTLGFTFNIAVSRFEARRQLVLDEANALGTLHLRSQLLTLTLEQQSKPLIRRYVELRADLLNDPQRLQQSLVECEILQKGLWKVARELALAMPNSPIAALFIEALNEVIDLHTSRVTVGLSYRVPPAVWLMLALVTAIAMLGVGYEFGAAGSLNKLASLILAISFGAVVMLIADLDHPYAGMLRVSQKPFQDLLRSID